MLTVVLSYSLYQLFANTKRGARFADKTRQALAFEQLRTQRTHVMVYAGGHFALFETLRFVQMVLQLSPPVQERLRTWLVEHLNQIQGSFQISVDSFSESPGSGRMAIILLNRHDSSPSTTHQRLHDEVYQTPRFRSAHPY